MTGLRIEGQADDEWHEIVHGVDVVLHRGEVLGLIGESGAGKSTIGLAAMGFARPGCRLTGGDIVFDGVELRGASRESHAGPAGRADRLCRPERCRRVQSGAPAHRPVHRGAGAPQGQVARRGGGGRQGPLRPAAAARAREDRLPLSAPGLRRAASTRHGRHGHGVPARPHRLRRADDGARRHHPDRGAGGDQGRRQAVRHGRHLHQPRSRRRRPDGGPHHGAAPRQPRGGGNGRQHRQSPGAGVHAAAARGSHLPQARRGAPRRRSRSCA